MAATRKGLAKLDVNHATLTADLDRNWAVLAEAMQTVMRRYGIAEPYEKLKELTRGHEHIDQDVLRGFIDTLDLPEEAGNRLARLTPETYIGLATILAELEIK